MKLPSISNMSADANGNANSEANIVSNGVAKGGRSSSLSNQRRSRGESVANAVAAVTGGDKSDTPNRYVTMKRVAEEQRRRVRDQRERQLEEERHAIIARRQEEMRNQIRTVLDTILVDVRKDILLLLQERINEERSEIKAEMKNDLQKAESGLVREVERRVTNGEPFESRVTRVQKEFEASFNKILKSELGKIQTEILTEMDSRVSNEKRKWEDSFKRETDRRIRTAEEAIRTDFRVGLEDSQKQCGDILSGMQERTGSLEQKLTDKIAAIDAEAGAKIMESERGTREVIDQKLDERDKNIKQAFHEETDQLRKEVSEIRTDVNQLKSKCCVIL